MSLFKSVIYFDLVPSRLLLESRARRSNDFYLVTSKITLIHFILKKEITV